MKPVLTNEAYLQKARDFAVSVHGGQRYGDQPYEVHLNAVVQVLKDTGLNDTATVMTGYLHDVIEDTAVTAQDLLDAGFPEEIVDGVVFCTDEPGETRKVRKQATYDRIQANEQDPLGLAAKWADRVSNIVACIQGGHKSKLKMYQKEDAEFRRVYYPKEATTRMRLRPLMTRYADQIALEEPVRDEAVRASLLGTWEKFNTHFHQLDAPVEAMVLLEPSNPKGPQLIATFEDGRPYYEFRAMLGGPRVPIHCVINESQRKAIALRLGALKRALQQAEDVRVQALWVTSQGLRALLDG